MNYGVQSGAEAAGENLRHRFGVRRTRNARARCRLTAERDALGNGVSRDPLGEGCEHQLKICGPGEAVVGAWKNFQALRTW